MSWSVHRTSLFLLVYLDSSLVRFFITNAIDCITVLSHALFPGNPMPSFVCRRLAPRPTPDASVSRFNCSFSL